MLHKITLLLLTVSLYSCSGNGTNSTSDTDSTETNTLSMEECTDPAAMEKIKKAISMQKVVEMTDAEVTEWNALVEKPMQGLQSFDIDTNFDANCIISITVNYEWMAAYPTSNITHLNFNKRTGETLLPQAFIDASKMNDLVVACNKKLLVNINDTRKALTIEDGLEDFNMIMSESDHSFRIENLGNFYISNNSIVFDYIFGFPHVIQALEPSGTISFSKEEFSHYINKDGPLAHWLK